MPTQTMETSPARKPLEIIRPDLAVAVPMTALNGYVIPRGAIVGRTASGKARCHTAAVVTTGFTTGSATGVVDAPEAFKVGDALWYDETNQNIGTIQSIVGNTITLTANAAYAVPTGEVVTVKSGDGAPVAIGVADEGSDGVGDTVIRVLIGGYLDYQQTSGHSKKAWADLGAVYLENGIFKF